MMPTIHFILRIERPSPDGSVALYIRVTFSRKQIITLATGKSIPLKKESQLLEVERIKEMSAEQRYDLYCWDKKRQRAVKGFGSAESLNLFIDDERKRANDILYDLHKRNRLTAENFKKEFLQVQCNGNVSFREYCLNEINKNRSEQFASETKRSYKSVVTKLDNYRPKITLSDITYKFLIEYENYMIKPQSEGGAGNNKRTVENNMKIIRTFISIACRNGDLSEKDYPFRSYKIKETEKSFSTRDFLEPEEILVLERLYNDYQPITKPIGKLSVEEWQDRENAGLITPGEYQALHGFLIGVYTGLRFRDVLTLTTEDHLKSKLITDPRNGQRISKYYLEIDAHKTGVNVIIPLIDKALKLIDVNKPGKICESISNQKINVHLKRIQDKAKLQKHLSFHVSRHSFATTAFEYGIPEKVVQSILGHRNRKFTEIYTHLSGKKLFFEMDKMNKGYSETELLLNECNKESPKITNEASKLFLKLQSLNEDKLRKLGDFLEMIA